MHGEILKPCPLISEKNSPLYALSSPMWNQIPYIGYGHDSKDILQPVAIQATESASVLITHGHAQPAPPGAADSEGGGPKPSQ